MTEQTKRPDRFAHFFRSESGRRFQRPLAIEKKLDAGWVKMADLADPCAEMVDDVATPDRLADALGGDVRLLRGDLMLAVWSEGECVEDYRGERERVA